MANKLNKPLPTWLVTGASGGIGQAIAEALCAQGDQVIAVGRRATVLRLLQAKYPQQVALCVADIASAPGRARVIAAAEGTAHLAGVVHAAGINQFVRFAEQNDADIAALLEVNVIATLQLVRGLLPALQKPAHSQLLLIGSTFGSLGYAGYASYSASKFALRGFAQALRREMAGCGVNVQYLAPRATRTAMNPPAVNALNQALKATMDSPERVAQAALKQLRSGQARQQLGWPEKLFVLLNAVVPGLIDLALRSQLSTIESFASGLASTAQSSTSQPTTSQPNHS